MVRSNGLFSNDEGGLIKGRGFGILRLSSGAAWTGSVQIFEPPRQVAMTLFELNDALLRIYLFESAADTVELSFWLATYDVPSSLMLECEARWTELFDAVFLAEANGAHRGQDSDSVPSRNDEQFLDHKHGRGHE